MKLLIDTNVILDMVFKRNDCEMEIMQFLRAEGCDKEDHASISGITKSSPVRAL